ncbi:alpha/beta fold hydrolase [Streptomyces sp. H27-H1]|uniref:alpha/beta fold hydrolase n=1 Tax=Streptomyces sp. H27-H1 TaxID=2996461 RepID=UPI00226F3929|nr:alpha/beta fold hydrolase [Streptomyces sp. H27-H1]MCY0926018.1 alpha/beta fold hydrolase [Streptomyces sp. H27-H1]
MILSHDVDGPAGAPAVVLLHSSVCDRRMWEPQWEALAAAGLRVVRPDFRTCGDSPASEVPYSDHEDVRELLDHLGIRRAALVGSSYGGKVALTLAALHPDRVSALALLCPVRPGHRPGPAQLAFGAAEDALLDAGDLVGAAELNARQWLGPEASPEAGRLVRDMQLGNFRSEPAATGDHELPEPAVDLSALTVPVLAVSGAHDIPEFRRIPADLAALIPGTVHVDLPWAGHFPSLERPAETTRMLLEFLPRA